MAFRQRDRHRLDADPDWPQNDDADPHANPTKFQTCSKIRIFKTFYFSFASLQCFIFLSSAKDVTILSILDTTWKFDRKNLWFTNFFLCLALKPILTGLIRIRQKERIRPDPAPQHCFSLIIDLRKKN